jgi:hypothetical protein
MPQFRTLSKEEVAKIKSRRVKVADLYPYMDYLRTLQVGDYGEITVEEGESRQALKRRTTVAAKQLGMAIKWRRSQDENKLLFEVVPYASILPMAKHKSIHHDEVDVSVPVKILYRSVATNAVLKEEQTTITLPLDQHRIEQLEATARQTGTPFEQLVLRLVAAHLSEHYHNNQDSALQAELEALRKEHGEFEAFLEPNGNIHLHTRTPQQ